jgi:hypothetical protein
MGAVLEVGELERLPLRLRELRQRSAHVRRPCVPVGQLAAVVTDEITQHVDAHHH